MTTKRAWVTVVQASIIGLPFAVAQSGDELISGLVWLAASSVSMVVLLLRDFLSVAALGRARLVPAWSELSQPAPAREARNVWNIHVLLVNAQRNKRTHAHVLRPRLVDSANHYLPLKHGFDLESDPARAAELLDDVAWLIDPEVIDRTPTRADLHRFFDIILGELDPVGR